VLPLGAGDVDVEGASGESERGGKA
jgi:hypothetical protein